MPTRKSVARLDPQPAIQSVRALLTPSAGLHTDCAGDSFCHLTGTYWGPHDEVR
jgi:hypothetical protein